MSATDCRARIACDGAPLVRAAIPACGACRRALAMPTSPSMHERVRVLATDRAAYVAHLAAQGVDDARRRRLLRAWDAVFGGKS